VAGLARDILDEEQTASSDAVQSLVDGSRKESGETVGLGGRPTSLFLATQQFPMKWRPQTVPVQYIASWSCTFPTSLISGVCRARST